MDNKLTRLLLAYLPRPVVVVLVLCLGVVVSGILTLIVAVIRSSLGVVYQETTNPVIVLDFLLTIAVLLSSCIGIFIAGGIYQLIDEALPSRKAKDD